MIKMVIAHVRPTVWWSIEIHYNGEDLMVHRYLDRPWIVLLLVTRRLVLDMLPSPFCVCRRRCPFGYIKITKASHTHMRLSCLPLCHHQFLFQTEEWESIKQMHSMYKLTRFWFQLLWVLSSTVTFQPTKLHFSNCAIKLWIMSISH